MMKAAVLHEPGRRLAIETIAIDKPKSREVLIRTSAAGVCHSDLYYLDGVRSSPLPVVLGHESAGIVEAVGSDVRSVAPGDHVITCLSAFCGRCEHCLTGHLSRCQSPETKRAPSDVPRLGARGNGIFQLLNLSSFAEQMLIHENACVRIRRDMPLDRAALIGCAVTTGTGAVINTANVRPGESVAVIGCGGIGLAAINGAAIAGAARIIAVDPIAAKRELAKEFGATDVIDATAGNAAEQVMELTRGGVHHAFEAVGLKETAEQAFAMLARGGTATIIGLFPPGVHLALHGADFLAEKRIQGSFMGSNRFPVDMPRLVDFYLAGKLKLDAMISRRIRLEQINEAFDELRTGRSVRSLIIFDG
jgi:S-(hydroxymethyl)glutathione dehydrogenase/alcohol dehydrogenase